MNPETLNFVLSLKEKKMPILHVLKTCNNENKFFHLLYANKNNNTELKENLCLQVHTEAIEKEAEENLVKLICDTYKVDILFLLPTFFFLI